MTSNTRTPKARALGNALRAARQDAGLTLRHVACQLGRDPGALSRWETGDRSPKPTDVAQILTILGVNGDRYEEILDMTRGTTDSHWLAVSLPEQRQQLSALLDFERTATTITHAAPLLIPGLLQSTGYVRAIMTAGGVPPEEVETRIAVRVGRREAITREDRPVRLKAAIGEAALRQIVGGPDVMAGQLDHLLKLSELDNIDVHVVPFTSGWHPALEGLFVLIESDQTSPAVHLEARNTGLFLHEPGDIDVYRNAAEAVFNAALDPAESKHYINRSRKDVEIMR